MQHPAHIEAFSFWSTDKFKFIFKSVRVFSSDPYPLQFTNSGRYFNVDNT